MTIPSHIAIIMDGNGRWAEERSLTRAEGHRHGAETIDKIVEACHDRNVRYLTLYAFSEENWQRPSDEVSALMQLLRHFLSSRRQKMLDKGIEFRAIGDLARLSPDVQKEITDTTEATKNGKKLTLIVALSYGSRQEIARAASILAAKGIKEITPELLSGEMYTAEIPDPDLLIRTSNEFRISNFLLWQLAYAEFYFTKIHWPDFDEHELDLAIESYSMRERRFGMTGEQVKRS